MAEGTRGQQTQREIQTMIDAAVQAAQTAMQQQIDANHNQANRRY
jgi:hypothetical protein